ncbi:UDP-N-acetylglucosamine 2-epimerase [Paenibacillus sp. R14(2021)]|uniref:UDP-N-acetylglucosamine 2-epimerase n=1 Tax=Paenibacillus sp. R14(2021) TaxID=2859228 RepID=UPI0021585A79|nr:UDP-N-acetylglucosamine 2-epimerase [Paenibacillus sp. R14(2021)]
MLTPAGKRKICVVTGTRAEYGLLTPLLQELNEDPDIELQLLVTGMHLSPEFGLTVRQIETDGFKIDAKVEMLLSSDTAVGITKSMGLALIGFADAMERLSPDIIVLLGDRYEIMTAAQAAMIANVPIAHLHGGESTEGAVDEAIRHSVTKMAHMHFTATEKYRQRVIQMGENPDSVHNVGAIGLDNIRKLRLLDKHELEQALDFEFGTTNLLVTYHPLTLAKQSSSELIAQLLDALDCFPDAKIIFTKPNSDMDGRVIGAMMDEYAACHPERVKCFTSLGQLRYLSALGHVSAVIGNSSSGIFEAPMFHIPTVNIGNRQGGRMKGPSVIDCGTSSTDIVRAINYALTPSFQESLRSMSSIYGDGNTAPKIKAVLKHISLEGVLYKSFYEIKP